MTELAAARPRAWHTGVAVLLGVLLFLVRPYTSLDPYSALWFLAGIYVALVVVSVGPAVAESEPAAPRPIALLLGLAAVAIVRITLHPVAPPDPRVAVAGLGVLAAIAEEAYFRRLLYGSLLRFGPALSVVATALLFSAMHYPSFGWAVLPIDFGAGLLFGWQRWATGSWLAPALTHAFANLLSSI